MLIFHICKDFFFLFFFFFFFPKVAESRKSRSQPSTRTRVSIYTLQVAGLNGLGVKYKYFT